VLPATDEVNGSGRVSSAVVLTNEPQGDLVLQLSGELKLDDAAPSTQTALTGRGYARYTADGKLVWFRSTRSLTGSDKVGAESALALVPPSDFALSYVAPNVQTEPVVPTSSYRLARVDASSGELTWQAKYPSNFLNGIPLLVVRSTQGDFLTFYPAQSRSLPGEACRAMDNGTSASVTCSGLGQCPALTAPALGSGARRGLTALLHRTRSPPVNGRLPAILNDSAEKKPSSLASAARRQPSARG